MKEDRLQHNLIMWFGQLWPEYRRLLFEVNNNPKNQAHGIYRKSMGMLKSVSDLILIVPNVGKVAGIELKAPDSIHKKEHIQNQLSWGENLIDNGGEYIMTSNIDLTKKFISILIYGGDVSEIESNCYKFVKKQLKNKTIKF